MDERLTVDERHTLSEALESQRRFPGVKWSRAPWERGFWFPITNEQRQFITDRALIEVDRPTFDQLMQSVEA